MKISTLLSTLILSFVGVLAHDGSTYQIHGSGTTNPSKCFWLIMEQFMDRAKLPLKMTYRAVGSSTGQAEFKGTTVNGVSYVPSNDFGSGDIPIPTSTYDELTAAGVSFVHLPFVLGAISVFHSIPGVPDGVGGLNLTSCLLARIFSRDIITWDHQDILDINPALRGHLPYTGYAINVAHRRFGSSSTSSITAFLRQACPNHWPEENVGSKIQWPADTLTCEGSAGMTGCIRDTPGTIGYIDSGHGHAEGLVEIELQNADGFYLSSKESAARGGIGAAAGSVVPSSADADFGSVNLLNGSGPDTWPIVTMSYVYVRKNLSFIDDPTEQSLLVAFLRSLYQDVFIDQCADLFGFTPVPDSVRQLAMDGISMLQVDPSAQQWSFEISTEANTGQGDYVISSKRRTYAELIRSSNHDDLTGVMTESENLRILVGELRAQVESLKSGGTTDGHSHGETFFTENDQDQLRAALVLSALSFTMCTIGLILFLRQMFRG